MNKLVGHHNTSSFAGNSRRSCNTRWNPFAMDFHPATIYVEKFGYKLAPHGSLSYSPALGAVTAIDKRVSFEHCLIWTAEVGL